MATLGAASGIAMALISHRAISYRRRRARAAGIVGGIAWRNGFSGWR